MGNDLPPITMNDKIRELSQRIAELDSVVNNTLEKINELEARVKKLELLK